MSMHDRPQGRNSGLPEESSRDHTHRLIAHAEALLADGGRSIVQSDVILKQSRQLAAANAAAEIREPFTRLCMALASEMTESGFTPTSEQVKGWRDRLITAAIAEKEGSGG